MTIRLTAAVEARPREEARAVNLDTAEPESRQQIGKEQRWWQTLLESPLIWGGLLTVGFYELIPILPVQRTLVERYFCGHPLEYATAGLFFVGIAILGLKGLRLSAEWNAISDGLIDEREYAETAGSADCLARIEASLRALPARLRSTHLAQRIRGVCVHLRGRDSTESLDDHLKYLAELAAERLHESYGLVRTITWAVPIIGFLGTVIGITIAIANVTPEQLETSLHEVTGGLAVAFDTTALALTLSLLLVFSAFLVERAEQQILGKVEDAGIQQISRLFPSYNTPNSPLAAAEAEAARELVEKTHSLIDWQTKLWQEALESTRGRWVETLESQQREFDESLHRGMEATLADHSGQLSQVRSEFLQAFNDASERLLGATAVSSEAYREMRESFRNDLAGLWEQIHQDSVRLADGQQASMEQLVASISVVVGEWQSQLHECTVAAGGQLELLREQQEPLLKIIEGEQQLSRLQARLTDNLDAVRAAETFEETLHSLNAAVHMLAARVKPKAA
jgi:biopolymer transport protein ExbB/TolQ